MYLKTHVEMYSGGAYSITERVCIGSWYTVSCLSDGPTDGPFRNVLGESISNGHKVLLELQPISLKMKKKKKSCTYAVSGYCVKRPDQSWVVCFCSSIFSKNLGILCDAPKLAFVLVLLVSLGCHTSVDV